MPCTSSSQSILREITAGTETETLEECCLLTYSLVCFQAQSLIQPKDTATHSDLGSSASINKWDSSSQTWSHANIIWAICQLRLSQITLGCLLTVDIN